MVGLPELSFFGLFRSGTNPGPLTDRSKILAEVEAGLPNHKARLSDALENQAFYDLDGDRYGPRREAETDFDYAVRQQCQLGFVQEVIDVLCEHQYQPGPSRTVVGDAEADKVLQAVYEQVNINAVMQEAEVLSTLNDVAAIQVHATNDADAPIELQLWGSEEFTVFPDPADVRKAACVVTIDRVNGQTRYRVWFEDVVRTFVTEPYSPDRTAGAIVARELAPPEPNTYGCLPFAFVHYRNPVRRFWTPGLGTFLRKGELEMNQIVTELHETIVKYLKPIWAALNVGPEWSPELGPLRFLRLLRSGTGYAGEDYAGDGEPSLQSLQAQIQAEQVWLHLEKIANRLLEAARVPLSAVRMEQTGIASGISLVVEQAPLLTRAKARRPLYTQAETCLAKVILTCFGSHYGKPQVVEAARALQLLLSWPQPRIPIPGPERDQSDQWELEQGITSEVMIVMERYGLSRDQAIAHLKQAQEDREELAKILPPPADPKALPGPGRQQEQEQEDLDEEDDDYGG